jgi:hypothetical protein
MAITADRVREIFKGLESGDGSTFFKHVAEDVDWSVMGTHPLAGHYFSKKAFSKGKTTQSGTAINVFVHTACGRGFVYGPYRRTKRRKELTISRAHPRGTQKPLEISLFH